MTLLCGHVRHGGVVVCGAVMSCGDDGGVEVWYSAMQWCVAWWYLAVAVSHSSLWHGFFMCLSVVVLCGDVWHGGVVVLRCGSDVW